MRTVAYRCSTLVLIVANASYAQTDLLPELQHEIRQLHRLTGVVQQIQIP